MRTSRSMLCSLLAVGTLMSSVGVAQASPGPKDDAASGTKHQTVVIDGRTFGHKDGLVVDTGSVVLSDPAPDTISTAAYTRYNFGTSYTSSNQGSTGLNYGGEAYAAANIFESLRVIQVCFQYRRGTANVTSWICSTASSSTGAWRAGAVASRTVWDSLDPYAPPTTFHYKTSRINPNII